MKEAWSTPASCGSALPFRTNGFEHLRRDPERARNFDGAMTNMSQLVGLANHAAYDSGVWGSLMDVGGGNGILLSHSRRAHPTLRGVLAD
jgi:hypothetical protein